MDRKKKILKLAAKFRTKLAKGTYYIDTEIIKTKDKDVLVGVITVKDGARDNIIVGYINVAEFGEFCVIPD